MSMRQEWIQSDSVVLRHASLGGASASVLESACAFANTAQTTSLLNAVQGFNVTDRGRTLPTAIELLVISDGSPSFSFTVQVKVLTT